MRAIIAIVLLFVVATPVNAALRIHLPTSRVWMAYSPGGIPVSASYEAGRPYRISLAYDEGRYPLGELRLKGAYIPTMPVLDNRDKTKKRYIIRTKIQFDAGYQRVAIGSNVPRWPKDNVSTGGPSFVLYYKKGRPVLKKTWRKERFRASEIRKKAWRNLICATELTSKGYGESETSVLLRFWGSLNDDRLIISKMQSERVPICAAFDAGHKFQFSRRHPAPTTKVALVIWRANVKKGPPGGDEL